MRATGGWDGRTIASPEHVKVWKVQELRQLIINGGNQVAVRLGTSKVRGRVLQKAEALALAFRTTKSQS